MKKRDEILNITKLKDAALQWQHDDNWEKDAVVGGKTVAGFDPL